MAGRIHKHVFTKLHNICEPRSFRPCSKEPNLRIPVLRRSHPANQARTLRTASQAEPVNKLFDASADVTSQIKMEVAEFRKKKLINVFNEFFDTNKNGVIDRGDFELAVQNVCLIRGWREDGPMHADTKSKFFQIWDSLKVAGGVKYDTGEVSSDVWVQLWANPMEHASWQQAYMNFMFNLFDTSGDGVVDMFEFTSLCSSYGVDLQESRKAYMYLSNNNNICVNKEYYSTLWKEYFYSEDPKAKGNSLFGRVFFE